MRFKDGVGTCGEVACKREGGLADDDFGLFRAREQGFGDLGALQNGKELGKGGERGEVVPDGSLHN